MQNKEFLGTQKVFKLIIKLAIPTIIAQIVNLLYNVIDRIYIGHILEIGDLALTGVGICMPIIMLISAFSAMIGFGGAPRASIYMGKKEDEKAEVVLGNSITLVVIISFVLTILLLIFAKPLLYVFGASDNTINYAHNYLKIYIIGSLFVMITLGLNPFISAQGFTKVSMVSVIIGALLNTLLDPIFIFAFKMGVQGAALATIISQGASSLFIILFLSSKKTLLTLKLKNLKLQPKIFLPALALGLSPFVMQLTEAIIMICFNASLKKYGGDVAVGSMTILSSLMQFSMLPLMGLAQGAQPVTSYNFGAQKPKRVRDSFLILLIISLSYSLLFWLLLLIMPHVFAQMFTKKAELINYTVWAIRIYFASCGIFGIQIACQQTFIAIGNAKISLFLAVLRKIILLIPLIFILPLTMDNHVLGVFLAEPLADLIAVSVTLVMFIIFFRKALKSLNDNALNKPL